MKMRGRGTVPTVISGRVQMNDIFAVIEIFLNLIRIQIQNGMPEIQVQKKNGFNFANSINFNYSCAAAQPFHSICRMDRLLSVFASTGAVAHVCAMSGATREHVNFPKNTFQNKCLEFGNLLICVFCVY